MSSMTHIQKGHKYIFFRGDKERGDEIILLFEYLGVKNDDNIKCDNEDMCYGIVPINDCAYKRSYKIGEFKIDDVKNNDMMAERKIYRYKIFKKYYIDNFQVGTKVFVKLYGSCIRIGKIGLIRFIHDSEDVIKYIIDLSSDYAPAHHLIPVYFESILATYDDIMKCLWRNINMYSLKWDYPEEHEVKYSRIPRTESNEVLVWDSFFGPRIDKRINGEWLSEKIEREQKVITPSVMHYDIAWMPITPPEGAEIIR